MNAVWTSPGIYAVNQRYEVRMDFTGHKPGMNAVWHSPDFLAKSGFLLEKSRLTFAPPTGSYAVSERFYLV